MKKRYTELDLDIKEYVIGPVEQNTDNPNQNSSLKNVNALLYIKIYKIP